MKDAMNDHRDKMTSHYRSVFWSSQGTISGEI